MKKSFFYITFIIFMSHAIVIGEEISKSFSGLDNNVIIDNEVFVDKIKAIILSQPEFSEAIAFKNQNNADRNYANFNSKLNFTTTLIPYQTNTSWIDEKIIEMKKTLDSETVPEINKYCERCMFLNAGKEFI